MSAVAYDRAVIVAADDALDLAMPCDDRTEGFGVVEGDPVHVGDAGGEGRVVHSHQGRFGPFAAAIFWSSHSSCPSDSAPWSLPGTSVSSMTRRTGWSSITYWTKWGSLVTPGR